jgi:predicted transcriptional regulator
MAESTVLTDSQLKAIALMAEGMSQNEAAKSLGCNRVTVNRWAQRQGFAAALAAEIERRRQRTEAKLQEAANEQIDQDVASLRQEMAEFHKAIVNVQKQRLSRGKVIMDKAFARLQDLPAEAIGVKDIAPLIMAADRLFEKGLETWGDALAVDDILNRMGSDGPE